MFNTSVPTDRMVAQTQHIHSPTDSCALDLPHHAFECVCYQNAQIYVLVTKQLHSECKVYGHTLEHKTLVSAQVIEIAQTCSYRSEGCCRITIPNTNPRAKIIVQHC